MNTFELHKLAATLNPVVKEMIKSSLNKSSTNPLLMESNSSQPASVLLDTTHLVKYDAENLTYSIVSFTRTRCYIISRVEQASLYAIVASFFFYKSICILRTNILFGSCVLIWYCQISFSALCWCFALLKLNLVNTPPPLFCVYG